MSEHEIHSGEGSFGAEHRRGRPRSTLVDQAIATAIRTLLVRDGYARLSIDRIAAEAGVSKGTIYRRWSGVAEMVAELIGDQHLNSLRYPDTGNIAGDLIGFMRSMALEFADEPGQLLLNVLSEIFRNDEIASAFRGRFAPRFRGQFDAVLDRAKARGEVHASVSANTMATLLVGALYQRIVIQGLTIDWPFIDECVNLVLAGATPR